MKNFQKAGGRVIALLLAGILLFMPGLTPAASAQSDGMVEAVEVLEVDSSREELQVYSANVEGNASRDGSLYSSLSAQQKSCYNALQGISIDKIVAASGHSVDVKISGINGAQLKGSVSGGKFIPADSANKNKYDSFSNDMRAAITALRYDRPDMLWLDGVVSAIIGVSGYNSTKSFTVSAVRYQFSLPYGGREKSMRQQMMNEAQNIANQARLQPDRYSKVKYVHDAICSRSVYNTAVADNPSLSSSAVGMRAHSAYSALIGGDAYEPVCDGYAKAVKIVCDLLDIPCVLAASKTHMWNNIKMDDGLWYNLDATWDDGQNIGTYFFLVGSQTIIGGIPFNRQPDHVETDPFDSTKVSGAKYPTKNAQAYQYIGKDYPKPTYPDVPRGTWYYDSVENATKLGYFSGDEKGHFNPGKRISRAEFAKVIANVMGVNTSGYDGGSSFRDVSPAAWYSGAVSWAKSEGIMVGDAGKFRPNDPISRQEMCVVLVRALGVQTDQSPGTFSDQQDIAGWAGEAVQICSAAGLIVGDGNGKFNPKNFAQRSEAATVFARYAKMIGAVT